MSRKVSVFVVCVCGLLGMSRMGIAQADDLFGEPADADAFVADEAVPAAQAFPAAQIRPAARPVFAPAPARPRIQRPNGWRQSSPYNGPQMKKIGSLQAAIRDAEDDKERDKLASDLEKLVQQNFDLELKQLEASMARLKQDIAKRKQDRETIIEKRIATLLDPNATILGQPKRYVVESIKKQDDGSSIAKVRLQDPIARTREEIYTVMVPQTRTRVVNGKEQNYTVNVPEQRTRTVNFTVIAPGDEVFSVKIPKGQNKDNVIAAFLKKKRRLR